MTTINIQEKAIIEATKDLFFNSSLKSMVSHLQDVLINKFAQPDGAEEYQVDASQVADILHDHNALVNFLVTADESVRKLDK